MRHSAIYEGTVTHRRLGDHAGSFDNKVAMLLLDLDEVEALADLAPLWRTERRAPMSYRRRDFLGSPDAPLRTAVLDLVEARTGRRPGGPVRLLAHHRTWGWLFNPIVLYYCYAADGTALEYVVADVTNTPWGESHAYVVDARDGLSDIAPQQKVLHVSPYLPMDLTYTFKLSRPDERCGFSVTAQRGDAVVFHAGLAMRRRRLTRLGVAAMLVQHPLNTHRVSAGIYAHAAGMWLHRVQFVPHP
ncbi:MAG TPA: DUF1365 domain-containing protein [Candidatus Dormibacteraeota bacterium]|nr:DUF1365 domain-containing protein [Candidatus Dormibacteraeota bacterium]